MADLRTDYKDDILDLTQNTRRKYRIITNDDDTVSFEDVTEYSQVGDSFGSAELNLITKKITEDVLDTLEEIEANTEENKLAGALAVKECFAEIKNKLAYKNITDKFTTDVSKLIIGAYVENGSVLITTRIKEGVTGTISAQLNDLTYAPRTYVAGTYTSMSSSADKSKFVGAGLSPEGLLTMWFDSALSTGENVTFTYPLKTKS